MFPTYPNVDLRGEVGFGPEDHRPGFRLRQRLAKHLGVVGDEDLEVRLVVHVLESLHADLVLHS
jgi:hypothetical protein